MPKAIGRVAFDSFLFGVTKSLEHLGEDRKPLMDEIEDQMLQYLIDSGTVRHPERQKEFAVALRNLFTRNGFGPNVPLRFKGRRSAPSVKGLIGYLTASNGTTGYGEKGSLKNGPAPASKVDWVLYEMALYGVTKALDNQLGVQAQLILDRIGTEMVDYLIKERVVKESDDLELLFHRIKDYFMKEGFAKNGEFRIEGDPPRALVATWTYAPYYTNVLKRLRSEGSALFSCPVCLMGESVLARKQGLKFQNLVEMKFLPRSKVYYRHKVIPPAESFTEEDAERISKLGS
jgi:hypothetical protein